MAVQNVAIAQEQHISFSEMHDILVAAARYPIQSSDERPREILQAQDALEPFWHVYQQHFPSRSFDEQDEPLTLLGLTLRGGYAFLAFRSNDVGGGTARMAVPLWVLLSEREDVHQLFFQNVGRAGGMGNYVEQARQEIEAVSAV